MQRGNNKQVIFKDPQDYSRLLTWLAEASILHRLKLHAYVLMTNHIHLLATPEAAGAVGKVMQSLGRKYVPYFNSRYERTGALWEGRYRATVIDSEEYFLMCSLYIELNPVRAGMVGSAADYRWSSHGHNAYGLNDPLVNSGDVYLGLARSAAERQLAYRALFQSPLPADKLAAIRQATSKGWALGNELFASQVELRSGRRSSPMKRWSEKGQTL